ncbi:MAG: hypothetical protein HGA54_08055 [Actinobacteria bacterium]|nr:hypothetical protein [Actinomycetota bacterium]
MKRYLITILVAFLMMNLCIPALSFAADNASSADSDENPVLASRDQDIGDYPASSVEELSLENTPVDLEPTASIGISSSVLWRRLAGDNRYLTMKAIVEEAFTTADTVIVATTSNYPDALAASGLAGVKGAPILLTDGSSLGAHAAYEISRLSAKNAIIVGGTGAVSLDVEAEICAILGEGNVKRASGENRMATALALYTEGIGSWGKTAIVATGYGFADALSISPYAYANKCPIFLTGSEVGDTELNADVKAVITKSNFDTVIIVGGEGVVSAATESELVTQFGEDNVTRLYGDDRYQTSARIAAFAVDENVLAYNDAALATGVNFPDALAGSTLCGSKASVLLLVDDSVAGFYCVETSIRENRAAISNGYILGGEGVLSKGLLTKVDIVCAGGEVVMGNAIVDAAFSRIGCPYEYGAEGPGSFDCSGLVWWCYEQAGYDIERESSGWYYTNASERLAVALAQPGDILWMQGHVGIYIGYGNYIHAADEDHPVNIGSWMPMWTNALRY